MLPADGDVIGVGEFVGTDVPTDGARFHGPGLALELAGSAPESLVAPLERAARSGIREVSMPTTC